MAIVHFYEKPGCQGNKRQREILLQAGHIVFVYDLLQEQWSNAPEKLRSFFGDLPVKDWFNRNAPQIKNRSVFPETLDEDQAIALMIADPILIRRPLLQVNGRRRAGFAAEDIEAWLNVEFDGRDLESCRKRTHSAACRP